MDQHIEQAIDNFRNNARRYDKTERYYRGDHNLAFASEKFQNTFGTLFREFALNLCPVIWAIIYLTHQAEVEYD